MSGGVSFSARVWSGSRKWLPGSVAIMTAARGDRGEPRVGRHDDRRVVPRPRTRHPRIRHVETVSAAALPTVQINGVVWDSVIVGNRVYATGQFTKARPAGAAPGTNETPRSNILAFDLTTGNLITSWAPTLNAQGLEISGFGRRFDDLRRRRLHQVSGASRRRVAALDAQTGALRPGTRAPTRRVDAIAVDERHGLLRRRLHDGRHLRHRFRPAAGSPPSNAATGAILPWAPTADQLVSSMVVHPGSGHVIVGGHFTTLNGTHAARDGLARRRHGCGHTRGRSTPSSRTTTTARRSTALTTDGTKVYGVGWAFLGGRQRTGTSKASFAADAATGALDWVDGGRGDNYDIARRGERALHGRASPRLGHARLEPADESVDVAAGDGDRQAPLADAHQRVRDAAHLADVPGPAGGATAALAAHADRREVHRTGAGGMERRQQRQLHGARR